MTFLVKLITEPQQVVHRAGLERRHRQTDPPTDRPRSWYLHDRHDAIISSSPNARTRIDVAAAGQTVEARALLDRLDDSEIISLGVPSGAGDLIRDQPPGRGWRR